MKIHTETERFILRDIEESDVQGIFEIDSDLDVHKYLGTLPIKTLKEAEDIIKHIHKQYRENGIGRMAIEDKKTKDFVGWTGIKYEKYVRDDFNYYDIGYRLKKEYWGKGIGSETAIESIRYGFEVLKLENISGAADIYNIPSNRILTKIGLKLKEVFEFEGVLHNWYALSRSEWMTL